MINKIDIIIPTRNRDDLVKSSLMSLQANQSNDFHVWVVDQSENTLTAKTVQSFVDQDGRFSLITSKTEGADTARNIGLHAGDAPLVAFIDDDCTVDENWLNNLLAEYKVYPEIDSIFGCVIPVEIPITDSNKKEADQIRRLQRVLPMAKKEDREHYLFTNENHGNLGFGHGANMSFRRSTFAKIGTFDEFLGGGAPLKSWEERDIGYRILQKGGRILYSPNVVVYHNHWRGWADVRLAFQGYAIGAGAVVGKYIRLGDWKSIELLINWMVQQGFRQILSGIFKWQSWKKTYAGIIQLVYPWVGLWQSQQYAIDSQDCVYIGKKGQISKKPYNQTDTVNA